MSRTVYLVPIFALFLLSICSRSSSIRLGSDGGYDLVVAVEQGSSIPEAEQLRYIQNIKGSIQVFSNQLWRATKRQFYVKSVEFILPEDWNTDDATDSAESGSYETADFKVSKDTSYPHAENSNLCGLPGKSVELPLTFFENANTNEFGPIWKTLLVLFARYRFGVWEEHGFVGDEKFPYFIQNSAIRTLEVTGCNNAPISGKYINITDSEDCIIDFNSSLDSCRFVPDKSNTVTSSLMHFHWMDSVVDFCDETNHNKLAENKHNTFCDSKSVMEVIRSTPDYNQVTNPRTEIPAVNFRSVIQSDKPIFYLLLDRGLIQGSHSIANMLPIWLASFFQRAGLENNIIAVGSYPNINSPNTTSYIKEEVPWSQIKSSLDDILRVIGEVRIDGPLERDFSRALVEVTGLIKQRSHPHGAVILVVNFGADLDNLNTTLPESDVILALNEQRIILHTVELAITSQGFNARSHLSQVASATFGGYATLSSNIMEATTSITNALNFVHNTLRLSDYISDQPIRKTIVKDTVTPPNYGMIIPIPSGSTSMEIFYSSSVKLQPSDFSIRIDNQTQVVSPRRTIDWNQREAEGVKFSYTFIFPAALINGKQQIAIQRNCGISFPPCDGTISARADIDTEDSTTDNVKIEVSTSANFVDLSEQIPLSIYAKVTKSGVKVQGLIAQARMTNSNGGYTQIALQDDGNTPDVLEGDGIFTGYFVPPSNGNGEYRISVILTKDQSTQRTGVRESSLGRLLPIDQNPVVGCEIDDSCPVEEVHDEFMQIEDFSIPVVFANAHQFVARPAKIFITLYNPINRFLYWISPRVPGPSANTRVDLYDIRQASTRQQLMNDFENCQFVGGSDNITVNNPGLLQSFQVPILISTTYFAIRSESSGVKSEVSNIRGFMMDDQQNTSPTPNPGTSSTPVPQTSSTPDAGTPSTPTPDPETPSTPTPDPETPSTPTPDPETPSTPTPDTETPSTTVDPDTSTTPDTETPSTTDTPVTTSSTPNPTTPSTQRPGITTTNPTRPSTGPTESPATTQDSSSTTIYCNLLLVAVACSLTLSRNSNFGK